MTSYQIAMKILEKTNDWELESACRQYRLDAQKESPYYLYNSYLNIKDILTRRYQNQLEQYR